MLKDVKGGSGVCTYCNKHVSNVSLRESIGSCKSKDSWTNQPGKVLLIGTGGFPVSRLSKVLDSMSELHVVDTKPRVEAFTHMSVPPQKEIAHLFRVTGDE